MAARNEAPPIQCQPASIMTNAQTQSGETATANADDVQTNNPIQHQLTQMATILSDAVGAISNLAAQIKGQFTGFPDQPTAATPVGLFTSPNRSDVYDKGRDSSTLIEAHGHRHLMKITLMRLILMCQRQVVIGSDLQ